MSLKHDLQQFRQSMTAAVGDRVRVTRDAEGWPVAPGKLGRIEWRGTWPGDPVCVYAWTDCRRMIPKLRAIPGVRAKQIGDDEAAVEILAGDTAAIQAVAGLLRLRRRRASSTGRSAADLALMRARSGRDSATRTSGGDR